MDDINLINVVKFVRTVFSEPMNMKIWLMKKGSYSIINFSKKK
jgi:hypothetical protein